MPNYISEDDIEVAMVQRLPKFLFWELDTYLSFGVHAEYDKIDATAI